MSLRAILAFCLVGAAFAVVSSVALGGCTGSVECPCMLCSSAVSLTVTDSESGLGVEDFVVEAFLDGAPLGEPSECTEGARDDSTCFFGNTPGYYHLIIRAPGYETREAVARVPARDSIDCCGGGCIGSRTLTVALDPVR